MSTESIVKKHNITGATVARLKGGTVTMDCYGLKSAENHDPVTPNTIFEVGSLSKTVFATAFLSWYKDTGFDLDAPLQSVCPIEYDLWNVDMHELNFAKITARMILNHTSGFNNWDNWCGADKRCNFCEI